MRVNRILLSTALVVVALVVQVSVLARLHLPGAVLTCCCSPSSAWRWCTAMSAAPSSASAPACSPTWAPPADHAAGRYALVLCVIGYCAGLIKPESGRLKSASGPMAVVVAAALGSTPALRRGGRPGRRHRRPPCRPAGAAVLGRPVRPAARPVRGARRDVAGPPRRQRPAHRDRARGQGRRHLLRLALLRHRAAHRQPARRPRRAEGEGPHPAPPRSAGSRGSSGCERRRVPPC